MTDSTQPADAHLTADGTAPVSIAFCITDLDPGGAEKALMQLVLGLNPQAWTAEVYCLSGDGSLAQILRDRQIPVHCYGARHVWQIGAIRWLKRHLQRQRPKVLQNFLFHANVAGRIAGRAARVPVIVAGHRVAEKQKAWHLILERFTAGRMEHHVCVSQGVAQHIQQALRLRPEQMTVIPNGVDAGALRDRANRESPGEIRQRLGVPPDAFLLCGAGRLCRQKNFSMLIEAFAGLVHEFPETWLVIAGSGPEHARLKRQIERLHLQKRVLLPGFQPDLAPLMQACDLFVLSSLWEGMPNVVLEAMALGKPIVATPVEGVIDLVEDGVHGRVLRGDSAAEMSAALRAAVSDPEARMGWSAKSEHAVKSRFTASGSIAAYGDVYRRLLGEPELT